MRTMVAAAFACAFAVSAFAADAPPGGGFSLPLSCAPGENCWIMNYPHVGGGAARDHRCGRRSYKGHNGTDFAIRDLTEMRAGIPVLAAAAGKVVRASDGGEDTLLGREERQALPRGAWCGNRVEIDHGGGWATRYCHLRKDSVAVKPGQRVDRGDMIGMVGLSGLTEFPHVHLTVGRDGKPVDPATGRTLDKPCGDGGETLWRKDARPVYQPVVLQAVGFASWPMSTKAIKESAVGKRTLPTDSRALVLWATIFGLQEGDRMMLEILAPDGTPVTRSTVEVARSQAWRLQYGGKKLMTLEWPTGTYNGRFRIDRPGRKPVHVERRVQLRVQ